MDDTSRKFRSTMINPQHVICSYMLLSFSWRTLLDLSSLLSRAWQQFQGFTHILIFWIHSYLESSCFTWPACCSGKKHGARACWLLMCASGQRWPFQIKWTLQSSVTLQALRGMGCRQWKSWLSPHGSHWHGSWPRFRGTSESQRCQRHNRSLSLNSHIMLSHKRFVSSIICSSFIIPRICSEVTTVAICPTNSELLATGGEERISCQNTTLHEGLQTSALAWLTDVGELLLVFRWHSSWFKFSSIDTIIIYH